MGPERCFFTVSFAMPTAVALSQWIGVGGCGWSISVNVYLRTRPSFMFKNNAPNSDSAAEAATNFNIVHSVKIARFSLMGCPSTGSHPRK
eukprot:scaffold152510_cov29-Attheya_sp.AAC.3